MFRIITYRSDIHLLEYFRNNPFHNRAVFQHIRHTGRYAQVIFQYIKLAIFIAHQIRAADMSPDAKTRSDAFAFFTVIFGLLEDKLRDDAVADNFLIVIQIVNKHIQRRQPLLQARCCFIPLTAGNNPRYNIKRPGTVDIATFGVYRERHPHLFDGGIGSNFARNNVVFRQRTQIVNKTFGGLAGVAGTAEQFVIKLTLWGVFLPLDRHITPCRLLSDAMFLFRRSHLVLPHRSAAVSCCCALLLRTVVAHCCSPQLSRPVVAQLDFNGVTERTKKAHSEQSCH